MFSGTTRHRYWCWTRRGEPSSVRCIPRKPTAGSPRNYWPPFCGRANCTVPAASPKSSPATSTATRPTVPPRRVSTSQPSRMPAATRPRYVPCRHSPESSWIQPRPWRHRQRSAWPTVVARPLRTANDRDARRWRSPGWPTRCRGQTLPGHAKRTRLACAQGRPQAGETLRPRPFGASRRHGAFPSDNHRAQRFRGAHLAYRQLPGQAERHATQTVGKLRPDRSAGMEDPMPPHPSSTHDPSLDWNLKHHITPCRHRSPRTSTSAFRIKNAERPTRLSCRCSGCSGSAHTARSMILLLLNRFTRISLLLS